MRMRSGYKPMGIDLIVSVQTMGVAPYLLGLWQPALDSVTGASGPQRRFFWVSRSSRLASTMKMLSMLVAMAGKRWIVYTTSVLNNI